VAEYVANTGNSCFHCKTELYSTLNDVAINLKQSEHAHQQVKYPSQSDSPPTLACLTGIFCGPARRLCCSMGLMQMIGETRHASA
jgi:hypothetical protein